MSFRDPDHVPRCGINLIGHVTGPMGLGVAARNTLEMLAKAGRSFVAIDFDIHADRLGKELSWQHAVVSPPHAPHEVNWFQLNPPDLASLAARQPDWLDSHSKLNVCVPFWELPRIPRGNAWREALHAMDLVLAPSRFILDAVRASVPDVPVVHYPQAVVLPEGIRPNRAEFGLPPDRVLFHVAADAASDLERKNPVAVIRAFQRAFPAGDGVGLVVKLSNTRSGHSWVDTSELVAAASQHPSVHLIDRDLNYVDALSLAASCDVCVSLHRAEGLGLGMLEAMSLGIPVIATAWSGNMDFTTAETACLVEFDLVPVRARHPAYQPAVAGAGQVWAEPREADAVRWMHTLARDPSRRHELGARAKRAMHESRQHVMRGEVLAHVERALALFRSGDNQQRRRLGWRQLASCGGRTSVRSRLWQALRHACTGRRP